MILTLEIGGHRVQIEITELPETAKETTESDGGAIAAVKAQGRLADHVEVEPSPSDEPFRAKAGEEANTTMRAASSDPVSRTDDATERQQSSTVEIADERQHGGDKPAAAASGHAKKAGRQMATRLPAAPKQLRPKCQRPDRCGGVGFQHCHSCSKLISEGEAA